MVNSNPGKDFGAAHNGLECWYQQRISAVLLIILLPLPFALLLSLTLGDLDMLTLLDVIDHPFSRIVHTLLVLSLLVHAYLGVKVTVEDYVPVVIRIPLMLAFLVLSFCFGLWWLALIWAWGV
ncbi:MAG: succinate dehydrogenase, hydrophobic membrane anchor protein [Mariprofundus sp.]